MIQRIQKETVFISNQTGWVRVYLNPDENYSTLVYVTDVTTVQDIVNESKFSENSTIWVQYYGIKRRRLKHFERPLHLQDELLTELGYDNNSRKTRIGSDPSLANIIKFLIGPASNLGINRCGYLYVLKGLVLPQWRKRLGAIIADKFFLYSGDGDEDTANFDNISLSGANIKTENKKSNKYVLRVTTHKQLFLGFENLWERNIWKKWMQKVAANEINYKKKLDLSDCGIEKVPKAIIQTWVDLEELELCKNQLNIECESLQMLIESSKLKKLSLRRTGISTLPLYITKLHALEYLDLSDNFFNVLPDHIEKLTSLIELNLDHNELSDISMLDDFTQLQKFSAAYNNLTNDCFFIYKGMKSKNNEENEKNQFVLRSNLSVVNLKGNLLKGVIKLANYGNLTDLDVSENNIEQLDLSSLTNLKCIKCSKNQLTDLKLNGNELTTIIAFNNKLKTLTISPPPIFLQRLNLSHNELELLPEWLSTCKLLQKVVVSHNRLTELPYDIFCNEESTLITLQLSFNQLTVLPQIMRRVPIEQLYLQNNSLITLPRHFFIASSNLRILNVSKNCLKELPQLINKNEKLEQLYLTSNALTDITPLLSCINLKKLHIAYNAINALPEGCVSAWSQIEELVISGNSLSQIPENVNSWCRLKIFRSHSNLLVSSPNFSKNRSLKILDLSNNYLEKIDLISLISKQLLYLDISGNIRLYVDSKQFHYYRNQRSINLVDVSGHNRSSLPFYPSLEEKRRNGEIALPWTLGFSETAGKNDKLYVSQLRLTEFCNSEALIGIFDAVNNSHLSKTFSKIVPRILLEERSIKETANDYMKYTMLSFHRELSDCSQLSEIYAILCHITKQKESKENNQIRRYLLRIATVGKTTTILCRNTGSLTLSDSSKQPSQNRLLKTLTNTNFTWNPHITEIMLQEQDQFLLLANKSLWNVMSIEEAVAEVQSVTNPVLAAKRLQDLAQSYGCEDNLSVMILRFRNFDNNQMLLTKDIFTTRSNKVKESNEFCTCEQKFISEEERSSPSGQSDKFSVSHFGPNAHNDRSHIKTYSYRKRQQSLTAQENFLDRNDSLLKQVYNNGSLADGEDSYSDKSALQMSEERFRCWEYMLEQNTQMLFDKELDTLSRNFSKRSVPSRPELWSPHTKSVSHLPDCVQNVPCISKRFGSARSYSGGSRFDVTRRSLNGGPNAAYFGSLQRLMPYHLEYNFTEIKEKLDNNLDSLEFDGRMHKYWDVATTEL
ncbi:hypothetical protein PGB90_008618 [Kerria lacca]